MTTLKIQQSQKQRDSNVIQRYGNKDSKITTTDKRTTKEQRQEKQQHQRLKQQQTLEIKTDIKEILNTENYNKEIQNYRNKDLKWQRRDTETQQRHLKLQRTTQ